VTQCLALDIDTSFPSPRVTRVLDSLAAARGLPERIRCDNGPELTSRHFLAWCVERRVALEHIQPGRPMQNGHIESFHGKLRDEFLNASSFRSLFDARAANSPLAQGLQRTAPAQQFGVSHAVRVCGAHTKREHRGQYVAEAGQGASNASPLPHTPIPARSATPKQSEFL
jgi:transposase InsO family protein